MEERKTARELLSHVQELESAEFDRALGLREPDARPQQGIAPEEDLHQRAVALYNRLSAARYGIRPVPDKFADLRSWLEEAVKIQKTPMELYDEMYELPRALLAEKYAEIEAHGLDRPPDLDSPEAMSDPDQIPHEGLVFTYRQEVIAMRARYMARGFDLPPVPNGWLDIMQWCLDADTIVNRRVMDNESYRQVRRDAAADGSGRLQTEEESITDKARKVDALLVNARNRAIVEDQMRFFSEWYTQWSQETEKCRKRYTKVDEALFDIALKDGDHDETTRRKKANLEARLKKYEPPSSPWDDVRSIPVCGLDDHIDGPVSRCFPARLQAPKDECHALCLAYVRLAVLRDMALRDDPAIRSITYGVLDSQEVEATYADMNAGWRVGWSSTIDAALAIVESDLKRRADPQQAREASESSARARTGPGRVGGAAEEDPQVPTGEPAGSESPSMSTDERADAYRLLLLLLAQAYYKMLECTVPMADWCSAVDLELNHHYLWVVDGIRKLLSGDELKDFPASFEPLLPDLYPSSLRDMDWEYAVGPETERFLSAVQQYLIVKGTPFPEQGSTGWCFLELFRPNVDLAVEKATAYRKRMEEFIHKRLGSSPSGAAKSAQDVSTHTDTGDGQGEIEKLLESVAEQQSKGPRQGSGTQAKLLHIRSRRSRKKTPPQLLKETRERQAAKELARDPDITAKRLGEILDCDKSTVVRLDAWKKKGVLHRAPPRTDIRDADSDEDAHPLDKSRE
jgi:hypothetical protein